MIVKVELRSLRLRLVTASWKKGL
jgi:hypothetical protein